jgi:alpha-1,2-glucosyltransferase
MGFLTTYQNKLNKLKAACEIQSGIAFCLGFMAFACLSVVFLVLPGKRGLYVDEYVHYRQIAKYFNGNFQQESQLTTLPGYHALMAALAIICNKLNVTFFRIISVIIASITIACFSKLYHKINAKMDLPKVLAFALLPIIFPLYFLIYTDILSLLLFILSLLTGLNKRYRLSALLGIFNLVVRQNTIFWYIFTFVVVYLTNYPIPSWEHFRAYLKKSWLFITGILLFIAFVLVNKGVAVGDRNMHPGNSIYLGNIFFFLATLGLLVFPLKPVRLDQISGKRYLIIASIFIPYCFFFEVTHPYNLIGTDFFIRNAVLNFVTTSALIKVVFFIPIAAGLLVLFRFSDTNPNIFWPFVVFGTMSLLPSWLIEQRYYFIHFAVVFLYGLEGSIYGRFTLAFVFFNALLLYGIFTSWFFI